MKIAFVTTQTLEGSTVLGRVMPLAQELARRHEVHVLVHGGIEGVLEEVKVHFIGHDPFTRSDFGKRRLAGWQLILRMLKNSWQAVVILRQIKPDAVVIVKSLPENVVAVRLWQILGGRGKIILDVDDFELMANRLTSLWQRAAVHWASRRGAAMATQIVAATPFLVDHFEQLTGGKKKVVMIPTGTDPSAPAKAGAPPLRKGRQLLYLGSVSITSGHRVDMLPGILAVVRKDFSDATLTIAGSGDDIALLKEQFAQRGLEAAVTWHGRFTEGELPVLLGGQPILIDPVDGSIANRAKSSFRVLISAAFGLPVITSDIGIRPYLLPQHLHSRFFAIPGDIQNYAEKIISLLKTPLADEQRSQMQQQAKQFFWPKLAQDYEKLLL